MRRQHPWGLKYPWLLILSLPLNISIIFSFFISSLSPPPDLRGIICFTCSVMQGDSILQASEVLHALVLCYAVHRLLERIHAIKSTLWPLCLIQGSFIYSFCIHPGMGAHASQGTQTQLVIINFHLHQNIGTSLQKCCITVPPKIEQTSLQSHIPQLW